MTPLSLSSLSKFVIWLVLVFGLGVLWQHPNLIHDWTGTALEQRAYHDTDLVEVGYRYGIAVSLYYSGKPNDKWRQAACKQLAHTDADVAAFSAPQATVEFLSAKLPGLGQMRAGCRDAQ